MTGEEKPKALILNSRQNLRPCGNDPWVINTGRAVEDIARSRFRLLTSVGMNSWEFALYYGACRRVPLEIFVPADKTFVREKLKDYYIRQFRLENCDIVWHFITADNLSELETIEILRDRIMIKAADMIYPISIRSGGNLDKLLEMRRGTTMINDKYQIPYLLPERTHCYRLNMTRINPQLDSLMNNYLIHWTRTFNRPWPGELLYDYYNSIAVGGSEYSHTGFHTLRRILIGERLFASTRHYRRQFPAVAFSSLKPSEAAALMRWRTRYREMSFEPYGLAVKKEHARSLGIREVIYGSPQLWDGLASELKPYFQSSGKKGSWGNEKEYRYIGDLDLGQVGEDNLIAIVWKKTEINEMRKAFEGKIISFYD